MKKIVLFFNGTKQAFKDSWFTILMLLLTCFVGIFGVGFCYRTAVFYVRQPELNHYYNGEKVFAYYFNDDNLTLNNLSQFDYLGIEGRTEFILNGEKCQVKLYTNDTYGEGLMDFAEDNRVVVLNENINLAIGDKVTIAGNDLTVAGKTAYNSYASVKSFDKISGDVLIYFASQLNRKEMSALEKAVGSKLNRDSKWHGKLTLQQYLFVALGIAVMFLISINIFRLFNLYSRKNVGRYKLYRMLGISKSRLNVIMFFEIFILLMLSLPISLLIDAFVFRPLTNFVGVTFMYDIIDILTICACVIVPFVLTCAIQMFANCFSTANGNRSKRGKKNG